MDRKGYSEINKESHISIQTAEPPATCTKKIRRLNAIYAVSFSVPQSHDAETGPILAKSLRVLGLHRVFFKNNGMDDEIDKMLSHESR